MTGLESEKKGYRKQEEVPWFYYEVPYSEKVSLDARFLKEISDKDLHKWGYVISKNWKKLLKLN